MRPGGASVGVGDAVRVAADAAGGWRGRTWLEFGVTALAVVAIQLTTVLIARWLRDRRITRARR